MGRFDWREVEEFEIVAEHSGLRGVDLWFNGIELVGREPLPGP